MHFKTRLEAQQSRDFDFIQLTVSTVFFSCSVDTLTHISIILSGEIKKTGINSDLETHQFTHDSTATC